MAFAFRRMHVTSVLLSVMIVAGLAGCCATLGRAEPDPDTTKVSHSGPDWPELFHGAGNLDAQAARAALPLPPNADPDWVAALVRGDVTIGGRRVQAQPVAWAGYQGPPRRVICRWLDAGMGDTFSLDLERCPAPTHDAGWDFGYTWVEGTREEREWLPKVRNVPLEQTEYEMYQLDLTQGERRLGVRLGLRWNERIYWWQFIRADFLARGPVFDVLRCGGPIYNEEDTVQGDLYLVLYENGVIEAYAHFSNHQREGEGRATHGVPVIAFDVPGGPSVAEVLDGSKPILAMGTWRMNLGDCAGYASPDRPGSFRTEGDVVVLQPWMDQEIYGELLVEREGVPEDHIVPMGGRATSDGYWVAKAGDNFIPRGMARTVRLVLSEGGAVPDVARYQAPAGWHGVCRALPTGGRLPVSWWAVPRALEVGPERYFGQHPRRGAFEHGASGGDQDGTLGAAMLLLGHATEQPEYCEHALLPAYWWADLAIDHVDFTVREIPKYSWQWKAQPYQRWTELVYAYWETGDPYLLETARFAADSFHRFFWTNRPHRSVGRDCLGVSGLFALYECTGEDIYLQRAREILGEVRRSYGQTGEYWPGHDSGCGPNGVGRRPDFNYIPMLQARLHVQLLDAAQGLLPPAEEAAIWAFIREMQDVLYEKGPEGGWIMRAVSLSYMSLTALAEEFPGESGHWVARLNELNARHGMPESHDGGKPYSWVVSALRFDAWAWNAAWRDGVLHLEPRTALLDAAGAPSNARIFTPAGVVEVQYDDGAVSMRGEPPCEVEVHPGRE